MVFNQQASPPRLPSASPGGHRRKKTESGLAGGMSWLAARGALLLQFPWEAIAEVDPSEIRSTVLPLLAAFLGQLSAHASAGTGDVEDFVSSLVKVSVLSCGNTLENYHLGDRRLLHEVLQNLKVQR